MDGQPRGHDSHAALRTGVTGQLLSPEDVGYDDVRRVWNGMHDRRPALIARCLTAADVSAAIRYAGTAGLPVTVRGGGHNVAGSAVADGTLMIDLSLMRAVGVDPSAAVAEAEGGCLLADVDAATTPHGLACPAGVVSHTGLAGLALGGGYGWLGRKWGLTCDHILAAEVVLADGSIVKATPDEHADLLWCLRGGGGNFGIVTRFWLRLRPVGTVHHQVGAYPIDEAAQALAEYRVFAESQHPDMHAVGCMKVAGQQDWIPRFLRGEPALFLTAVWLGEPAKGPEATAGLFGKAVPAGALSRQLTYAELQALGDHGEPHGNRYFTKSCYLEDISPEAADAFVISARDVRSPLSSIDFEYLRGEITSVPDSDSAFPRRDAPYIYTASAQWTDPSHDFENIAWSRRSVDQLEPWHYGGAYINYVQDEPAAKVREVYREDRYRKLMALKSQYDPANVLRSNQNIVPARAE
ncbi:FAD-binding oxidoreductase [Streptomyces sp. NBC_00829]|uniref:FAD-binding oxidoreductase n=1 Tax=Streptomyces sp. NBC_00829 TaxID=2903679 RepID=UPI00386A4559|nr:FAD-binding oxidoreductase [Streptomyces sp. NBC_00829]